MKKFLCVTLIMFVSGCGPRWGDYRFLDSEAFDVTDGNMESPYQLDVETPDATIGD
jgi:hypothetical protein